MTIAQKTFLNKIFDQGEITNNKVTAHAALSQLKNEFDVKDYLPLNTIKSYFSRRTREVREGKFVIGEEYEAENEIEEDNVEDNDYNDDSDDDEDEERENAIKMIEMNICKIPDLQRDDWIVVAFPGVWFPGQFCSYDNETEEIEVHFV